MSMAAGSLNRRYGTELSRARNGAADGGAAKAEAVVRVEAAAKAEGAVKVEAAKAEAAAKVEARVVKAAAGAAAKSDVCRNRTIRSRLIDCGHLPIGRRDR